MRRSRAVNELGEMSPAIEQLLEVVSAAGVDGITTDDIAKALGWSFTATSAQASRLCKSGYVHNVRRGRHTVWIIGAAPNMAGANLPRVASVWKLGGMAA